MTGMSALLRALEPAQLDRRFHAMPDHERLVMTFWCQEESDERAAVMLHEVAAELALGARK